VAAELHDLRQLAATVDALEQDIAQKASRLAAVEGELSDLRREVEWTEQLHAKQQLRLGELEAQLDRSLARQRQLDVEARDLRERAARSDELARGLADRNARLGALREDLTRQMMRISRLETELAERGIIARQLEAELARARGLSRPAIRPEPPRVRQPALAGRAAEERRPPEDRMLAP
jgi:chromosome segregation ATPase